MANPETQHETMKKAEPQKEHRWLEKLVGDWTYEMEAPPEPGKPVETFGGTEHVRSLDGLWFIAEGEGEMPGSEPATSIMTLGYDPKQKRYVGTWIGSMMTHLWVYDNGQLDGAGRVLTLEAEGPTMSGDGGMTRYKDVIEFRSDDHRVLTGNVLTGDGTWQQMMTVNYRRKR
ncbi:MAG: DUF1579 domain-containing protein [Longimicrobiales bacterium]